MRGMGEERERRLVGVFAVVVAHCTAKYAENRSPDGHAKTPDIAGVRKRARALTQLVM